MVVDLIYSNRVSPQSADYGKRGGERGGDSRDFACVDTGVEKFDSRIRSRPRCIRVFVASVGPHCARINYEGDDEGLVSIRSLDILFLFFFFFSSNRTGFIYRAFIDIARFFAVVGG